MSLPKLVFIVRLILLGCLIWLIWDSLPRRLDVKLRQAQTVYQSWAGSQPVTVTLIAHGDDNGSVTIEVRSADRLVGSIESQYNYDFFSNQPAGWLRRTWIDGDWQRDLLLITSASDDVYGISSRDGKIKLVP